MLEKLYKENIIVINIGIRCCVVALFVHFGYYGPAFGMALFQIIFFLIQIRIFLNCILDHLIPSGDKSHAVRINMVDKEK